MERKDTSWEDNLELLPHHEPVQPGMGIAQRLKLLQQPTGNLPTRTIKPEAEEDPYGLLEHRDTYEALAGLIFQECEGIYKQLARANPEVTSQYNKAARKAPRDHTLTFPVSKLGNLYSFQMSRSQKGSQASYLFRRADRGYEETGFRVTKDDGGNIVLKNLNPDCINIQNDGEYYPLLANAHRWVQDYGTALNIDPQDLIKFSELKLLPRTSATIAKDGLKRVFTTDKASWPVPESKRRLSRYVGRRPRYSAILLAALAMPISTHGVLAESVARTAGAFVTPGKSIKHRPGTNPHQAAINTFDSFNSQLPVTSTVTVGASMPIAYEPTLNPFIEKAPVYSDGAKLGAVRRLDSIDMVYPGGFDGLEARSCAPEIAMSLGQVSVRVVNTDPIVGRNLTATTSNDRLAICNNSTQDLEASNLQGVYVEPLK